MVCPLRRPRPARTPLRELLERKFDAWNREDLDGFMTGYWKSA